MIVPKEMNRSESGEPKPTPRQCQGFAMCALTHYAALFLYFYMWTKAKHETPLTTALFFIGLTAWLLQIAFFLLLRKRSPVIARLSLFVFVSSLLFGLLGTPLTD